VERGEKMAGQKPERGWMECQGVLSEGWHGCEGEKRLKVREGSNMWRICLHLVSASVCLQKGVSCNTEVEAHPVCCVQLCVTCCVSSLGITKTVVARALRNLLQCFAYGTKQKDSLLLQCNLNLT